MKSDVVPLVQLDGQTALVTGASRGLGRSIAILLAKAGAHVYVNYAHDTGAAEATLRLLKDLGASCFLTKFDVCNAAQVDEHVTGIVKEHGRLDILVNNAGVSRDNLLGRLKDEDWRQVLDTNVFGTFVVSRRVAKTMIRNRAGRIINITSVAGEMGNAGQVNYSSAKGALIGFTKALARELAPRNILVNAVSPGLVAAGMTEHLSDTQVQEIAQHIPLRRLGEAEDVAHAVLFLCSRMSNYITGHILRVNGGLYM